MTTPARIQYFCRTPTRLFVGLTLGVLIGGGGAYGIGDKEGHGIKVQDKVLICKQLLPAVFLHRRIGLYSSILQCFSSAFTPGSYP